MTVSADSRPYASATAAPAKLDNYLGISRENFVAALVTVSVTSFLSLIACVASAAIIFSGDLAPYLPVGIGIALLSATILGLVMSLSSAYPGTQACAQSTPTVILSLIATSLAARL